MTEPQRRQQQPQNRRQDVAVSPDGDGSVSSVMKMMERRKARIAEVARVVSTAARDFERLLPAHIPLPTFMQAAGAALYRSEELMEGALQRPDTLLNAMREAAMLGHVPGTPHYWLTPRKQKFDGGMTWSILGIEGYEGIVERMYRSGGVLSVHAEVVRANDEFDLDAGQNGRPVHRRAGKWGAFSPKEERGEIIGSYAYAILPGGWASQVVLMSIEELLELKAANAAAGGRIWTQHPVPMYKKSALRRLEPYVPVSSGYRESEAQRTSYAVATAPTMPLRMEDTVDPVDPEANVPSPDDVAEGEVVPDRPVTGVRFDPAQWGGEPVGPAGWEDMSVARPGDGLPYDQRHDQ